MACMFAALLIFGTYSRTQAQENGRPLSTEELIRLIQVDSNYKQNVTLDANGNYVDHNSEEAYAIATAKADAIEHNVVVNPSTLAEAEEISKTHGNTKLPKVLLTGDEEVDVQAYIDVVKSWLKRNPAQVKGLNEELRAAIEAEEYKSLYLYQVVHNKITKTNK